MSSSTSLDISSMQQDSHQNRQSFSTSTATKLKIAIGVVLALAVIAAVGVCAVVFVPKSSTGDRRQGDTSIDLETRAKLLDLNKEVVGTHVASIARREGKRRPQKGVKPCYSELTNDSYPAAHIVGHGNMWDTTPEPSTPENPAETYDGYVNNWLCDYQENHNAYVDGGMNFTQTDRKLHVPLCGYYYVSSQIYFQVMNNSKNNSQYAYHQVVINRNCPQIGMDNTFSLKSYSTLGPLYEDARFSTYIGDVVKMCEGGTIEIAISNNNPCCPYGSNSYIAAHLVAETSCDWRPKKLEV